MKWFKMKLHNIVCIAWYWVHFSQYFSHFIWVHGVIYLEENFCLNCMLLQELLICALWLHAPIFWNHEKNFYCLLHFPLHLLVYIFLHFICQLFQYWIHFRWTYSLLSSHFCIYSWYYHSWESSSSICDYIFRRNSCRTTWPYNWNRLFISCR